MQWPSIAPSDPDRDLAEHMAKKRNVNESHFGGMVYDQGYEWAPLSSYGTHYVGALGEIGAARLYDVEPDLVFLDKGGSNPWDLVIDGLKVEVKAGRLYQDTTLHQVFRPQHLFITVKKVSTETDAYMRCAVDIDTDTVYLVGWCTREQLVNSERVEAYSGLCYKVDMEDLNECHPHNRRPDTPGLEL